MASSDIRVMTSVEKSFAPPPEGTWHAVGPDPVVVVAAPVAAEVGPSGRQLRVDRLEEVQVLADLDRVVAGVLERRRDRLARSEERAVRLVRAVVVRVEAGEEPGSAGAARRRLAVRVAEADAMVDERLADVRQPGPRGVRPAAGCRRARRRRCRGAVSVDPRRAGTGGRRAARGTPRTGRPASGRAGGGRPRSPSGDGAARPPDLAGPSLSDGAYRNGAGADAAAWYGRGAASLRPPVGRGVAAAAWSAAPIRTRDARDITPVMLRCSRADDHHHR